MVWMKELRLAIGGETRNSSQPNALDLALARICGADDAFASGQADEKCQLTVGVLGVRVIISFPLLALNAVLNRISVLFSENDGFHK